MNKIVNILEKIQSSVQVGGGGTIFFSYSADQISDSVFFVQHEGSTFIFFCTCLQMPFNIQASSSVDRSVEEKLIEQGAFAENWEEKLGCSTSFHSWKLSSVGIKLPRDPFFLFEMI